MAKKEAVDFFKTVVRKSYSETRLKTSDTGEADLKRELRNIAKNVVLENGFHCPSCGRTKKFYHIDINECDIEYPFYCGYCEMDFLICEGGGLI